MHSTAEKHCGW